MNEVLTELKNPEFWMSFAFVLVVVISVRPALRFVRRWAKKEALTVKKSLKEAADVRRKAADLLVQYQEENRRQPALRKQAMAEADSEIAVLQEETDQRTNDVILHKKQETALRLKMIEENSRQDVKNKMLRRIVRRTEKNLTERRAAGTVVEDMDSAVEVICQALTEQIPG